jgi:hypothetical protein
VKSIPYSFSHPDSLYIYFFYFYVFIFRKQKSNQTSFNYVIFNLEKLDSNIYAILEVRHPQYSHILQGFVLLRMVILLLMWSFVYQNISIIKLPLAIARILVG